MRGTQPLQRLVSQQPRFIPACAGNASNRHQLSPGHSVHPRVCGERFAHFLQNCREPGSSPRVRGTLERVLDDLLQRRFIPACAGNAQLQPPQASQAAVHPRVCGERSRSRTDDDPAAGSSPRVRGTPRHYAFAALVDRFIPACAGNASARRRRPMTPAVHPRVCGERWPAVLTFSVVIGSSPRVRGTLRPSRFKFRPRRFIPACAGNATVRGHEARHRAVHPRVCGERFTCPVMTTFRAGSSPRVRGTHPP